MFRLTDVVIAVARLSSGQRLEVEAVGMLERICETASSTCEQSGQES